MYLLKVLSGSNAANVLCGLKAAKVFCGGPVMKDDPMWLMYVVNACDQKTAANVCDRKVTNVCGSNAANEGSMWLERGQ